MSNIFINLMVFQLNVKNVNFNRNHFYLIFNRQILGLGENLFLKKEEKQNFMFNIFLFKFILENYYL